MSLIGEMRKEAGQFARGERAYAPGEAGIPVADRWWGVDPLEYTPEEFGNYVLTSNPVFSCVTQRSKYLASLPLRLFRVTEGSAIQQIPYHGEGDLVKRIRQRMNGKPTRKQYVRDIIAHMAQLQDAEKVARFTRQMGMEEVTEGDAYELLHRVNNFWTMNRLIQMTSMARDLWGQSYWLIEREGPRSRGKPLEIWWTKPTLMRPIPHPRLYISHYELDPEDGGEPIPFYPWEVVRIYNPNPVDEFQGLSPLSSTSIFADHEKNSMTANMNLHKMGLHPGAIIMPEDKVVWTEDQAREIEKDVNKRFAGADKAHRWGTFRQRVFIHQSGISPRESEFLGGMDYDVEAVARAYDWPIDLLAGKRTYENVEQAFKRAWQTTVIEGAVISADIAEFYLPMFDEEEVLIPYFDPSGIAVMQETESAKWEREQGMVDKVITRNEWRRGRGLEPIPGGDALYIHVNQIPLEVASEADGAQEPVPDDAEQVVASNGNP